MYFDPTNIYGWIIRNTHYEIVRETGRKSFIDIGPAESNAAEIKQFLTNQLRVPSTDIFETVDATWD